MIGTIELKPTTVRLNYASTLADALQIGKFSKDHTQSLLRDERRFASTRLDTTKLNICFFRVPIGCRLKDLPHIMEERGLRHPTDPREVFAIGALIEEQECAFNIHAPEITGNPDHILRVHRWPNWEGLGALVSEIDTNRENVSDLEWIGFSDM